LTEVIEGLLVTALLFDGVRRWGGWHRLWWRGRRSGCEAEAADLEVFFEAVELEEVGELEGADVTTAGADFALEVEDHRAHVLERVTSVQEVPPAALAVKTQAQALAGELEVELMGGLNASGGLGGGGDWSEHEAGVSRAVGVGEERPR